MKCSINNHINIMNRQACLLLLSILIVVTQCGLKIKDLRLTDP